MLQFYHKMHLVPFGEYFPLIESLPWLAALTPYRGEKLTSLNFGHSPLSLPLGPYRLAVSICFEDTIPHVIRRSFADPSGPSRTCSSTSQTTAGFTARPSSTCISRSASFAPLKTACRWWLGQHRAVGPGGR